MNIQKNISFQIISFFVFLILTACGCTSRYRLDLFVVSEGINKKVKVEQTRFIENTNLGNPQADYKLIAGDDNTAILTLGTRWKRRKSEPLVFFDFDEYWKSHLYLELPHLLKKGRYNIQDKSMVHILGRYDINPMEKIFLPTSGSYSIDSVTTKQVFITINGEYENHSGQSLGINGKFKVKIAE